MTDNLVEGKNKEMIPKNDTLSHFGITASEMNSQPRSQRYEYLCAQRTAKREKESILIEENLAVATERDTLTRRYFSAVLNGNRNTPDLFLELYSSLKGVKGNQQMGFHVVFMLDESGSMEGSPFKELQGAYNDFIRQRLANSEKSEDLMTVINFSSSARTIATLVPFTSAPTLPFSGGGTNFYPAFQLAESALQTASDRELIPILILMTDGASGDLSAAQEKLSAIDATYKDQKLQIHFVAFGSNVDHGALNKLKKVCTDGNIHTAAMGDLSATFKEIESALVVPEYYGGNSY